MVTFPLCSISELYYDIQKVLSDRTQMDSLIKLVRDLQTLRDLDQASTNGSLQCEHPLISPWTDNLLYSAALYPTGVFKLGSVLVDPVELEQRIRSQNISLSEEVIDEMSSVNLNASEVIKNHHQNCSLS